MFKFLLSWMVPTVTSAAVCICNKLLELRYFELSIPQECFTFSEQTFFGIINSVPSLEVTTTLNCLHIKDDSRK